MTMPRRGLQQWRQMLYRPTPQGDFLPVIDGLRFVAILSVVLYHLNDYLVTKTGRKGEADWLSGLLAHGHVGVPLFFALSGFIIARPFLAGTAPGIGRYFLRRLRRLEPPYLINLLLVYALLVMVLGMDAGELFPHLVASALYVHHLVFGGASTINFVAWSLEVEFQFYVLAPFLLAALGAAGTASRRIALVGLVLLGGWAHQAPEVTRSALGLTLLRYGGFFAAGVLAADVFVNRWQQRPAAAWRGDALVLLGVALAAFGLAGPRGAAAVLPAAMLLILLGSLGGRWAARALSVRPVYLVGGMCYTLYLYHFYVISAVGRLLLPWMDASRPLWLNLLLMALGVLPIVLVAGIVMFVAVERPFMSGRGRSPPRPPRTGVEPAAAAAAKAPTV
jgi:peptidoglycan/LPS O-acetylase OafA/YrhL